MKLLVTGGREYANVNFIHRTLDEIHAKHGIEQLIHGAAPGVDMICHMWAAGRGITVAPMPITDDDRNSIAGQAGRAGNRRNARMLDEKPDALAVFPGCTGTANMLEQATARGVEVMTFNPAREPA